MSARLTFTIASTDLSKVRAFLQAKKEESEAKRKAASLRKQLFSGLRGTEQQAVCAGIRVVTWGEGRRSVKIDADRLRRDFPEAYAACAQESISAPPMNVVNGALEALAAME